MSRRKRRRQDRITIDEPVPCPALWKDVPRGHVKRLDEEKETNEASGSIDVDFSMDCYV